MVAFSGELQCALIIWLRHQEEFADDLNPDVIKNAMDTLPKTNVEPLLTVKIKFLKHFLPDCLRLCDQTTLILDAYSNWALDSLKSLAMEDRNAWPLSGIQFANNIFAAIYEPFASSGEENFGNNRILAEKLPLILQEQRVNKVIRNKNS